MTIDTSLHAAPSAPVRPEFFTFPNGEKAPLPFSQAEYDRRLAGLRAMLVERGVDAAILTSMHSVTYFSGFLYCAFGRPYACVVTQDRSVTVSANIDGGQPWRRSAHENVVYTDWKRDNYWRAIRDIVGSARRVGIESDHLTLAQATKLTDFLGAETTDIAGSTMAQRMVKSAEEIALIREGARIADIGGAAVRDAIQVGTREIDVAMAGREAMEAEIARAYPDSELRDSWVWFQSGLNTDGAHNPLTTRKLEAGDILSLNTFPMISGYYTALERTLFVGEPDKASLAIWEANVGAHELGLSLIRE
ncbi:MAG: aminopeptidase P family N-terminal domain-containing protein, partial [Pseudomonadota bacterium]